MIAPTRPILRWHGGKWRIANWIISHFPEHRVYVEPFGGGGSVLLRKPPSETEVYNDIDGDVVNVFRVLRDPRKARQLRKLIDLTPFSREEFLRSYERAEDDVERARRTIVRCLMGHGTTSRRLGRTGFRRKGGGRTTGVADWRTYPDALSAAAARLRLVLIEHRDAIEVIRAQDRADALFYVDPPYPISTRSSVRSIREKSRAYAVELTDDDHRQLAAVLAEAQGAVVVSGYPCHLYDDELYSGWERHERAARADGAQARTEVVWIKPAGTRFPVPRSFVQSSLGFEK